MRNPERTFAKLDHNVPTKDRDKPVQDPISAKQMQVLASNCEQFDITLFDLKSENQGIVHSGWSRTKIILLGKTIVCGDSHTSTHGAFGALAFGIGTSEVEHVLSTQCLLQSKPKMMKVNFKGSLPPGVYAKDMVLALIGKIGIAGATGYAMNILAKLLKTYLWKLR